MNKIHYEEKNKSPDKSWGILFVTFIAGTTAPINMFKGSSLATTIADRFSMNTSTLGWTLAMFYLFGFIIAVPAAKIVKTQGSKKVITISILCGLIGSFLGAVSPGLAWFLLSRMIEGAGFSILGVAGASALSPWFTTENRGFALGIWSLRVSTAGLICPVLFGWLIEKCAWTLSSIWWATAAYDFAVLVIFNLFFKEHESEVQLRNSESGALEMGRVLKNKKVISLTAAFFFYTITAMSINNFLTTYLCTELGSSLVSATTVLTTLSVANIVGSPLIGKLSDRLNSKRSCLIGVLIVGLVYASVIFNCRNQVLFYPIVIFASVFNGGVPALIWATVPAVASPKDVPAANAAVAFAQNFGNFLGAMVLGNVITRAGWTISTFGVLVPCVGLALISIVMWLKEEPKNQVRSA